MFCHWDDWNYFYLFSDGNYPQNDLPMIGDRMGPMWDARAFWASKLWCNRGPIRWVGQPVRATRSLSRNSPSSAAGGTACSLRERSTVVVSTRTTTDRRPLQGFQGKSSCSSVDLPQDILIAVHWHIHAEHRVMNPRQASSSLSRGPMPRLDGVFWACLSMSRYDQSIVWNIGLWAEKRLHQQCP